MFELYDIKRFVFFMVSDLNSMVAHMIVIEGLHDR
jgi:hypothetical protein